MCKPRMRHLCMDTVMTKVLNSGSCHNDPLHDPPISLLLPMSFKLRGVTHRELVCGMATPRAILNTAATQTLIELPGIESNDEPMNSCPRKRGPFRSFAISFDTLTSTLIVTEFLDKYLDTFMKNTGILYRANRYMAISITSKARRGGKSANRVVTAPTFVIITRK